jgi:hypothetical protein
MRYSAAEKLEIIRLVEQSLAGTPSLGKLGLPRVTFTAGTTGTGVAGRRP